MSDYMPETNGTTVEFQEKHDTILKTELECHPGKLKTLPMVTNGIKKTSCLHETEEGHAVLADYIWKEIENRYKTSKLSDLPHAKLHDILIHTPNSEAD
jgi:hypothetical protein